MIDKFEKFFEKDDFDKKLYEDYYVGGRNRWNDNDNDNDNDTNTNNDNGEPIAPYVPKQLEPGQEWWN